MGPIQAKISNLGNYDTDIANAAKQDLLLQSKIAIPHLVAALTNPDQVIVAEIAQLLGLFRKDAIDAVEALVTISYVNNPRIRANAIASLGLIAEKADICIPILKRYVKDSDINVRRYAVAALGVFGHTASDAVYELVEALEDEDAVVREFAAGILYELGSVPLPLVKRIVRLYKHADPYVRYAIIKLLVRMRLDSGMTISEQVSVADIAPVAAVYSASPRIRPRLTAVS